MTVRNLNSENDEVLTLPNDLNGLERICRNYHARQTVATYEMTPIFTPGDGWLCESCEIETWVPYGVTHTHGHRAISVPPTATTTFQYKSHSLARFGDTTACISCGADDRSDLFEFKLDCDTRAVRIYRSTNGSGLRRGVA